MNKIFIAGHQGLVGSGLVRRFSGNKNRQLLVADRSEMDLTDPAAVFAYLDYHKPDSVVVAAGRVGGIQANAKYPGEFIYQNLMIEANLIHGAWQSGVRRLLNFGSSCIYPKESPQPMHPNLLMTGKLEPTNEPYALAKLAGMSLCTAYNRQYGTEYINAIPSNVYGPGENFDLERCHALAALMRRFHEAKEEGKKEVTLWGTGRVERDFLYVDDLATACERLLEKGKVDGPVNIGAHQPCTIQKLAHLIAEIVGFEGKIKWDTAKPDGAPRRVLDATEIQKMDWKPQISLQEGIAKTYRWFVKSVWSSS